MFEVRQTETFHLWFEGLCDAMAKRRISQRIVRLQAGLLGDAKPVGEGVSELRIDHGPGYRLYFVRRGVVVLVLLCGGDKSSQQRDVAAAKRLAVEVLKEPR